jgi:hypothetical protein
MATVRAVRLLIATAGLLALAGAAAAAAGMSHPQTIRRSAGPVEAVTQDGRAVAWLAAGGSKCNAVHVVTPSGDESMPQPSSGSMTCHWDLTAGRSLLAFASGVSSALWTLHESGSVRFDYVLSAHTQGREQMIERLAHASDGTGWWLGGLAGAGSTLAYSKVDVEYVDKLACLSGGSCKKKIADGAIYTVSGGVATALPGSPPALDLAAADNRIAYVPATTIAKSGAPAPSTTAVVTVVDARKGTLVSQAQPDGLPLAIALSPHVLAVLTRDGRRDRVSWYAAADGEKLGSSAVPRSAAPQLTASNRMVVYRVGRLLRGIVLSTSRTRKLVRAASNPVGPSLLRSRLVWAENSAQSARIRELFLG